MPAQETLETQKTPEVDKWASIVGHRWKQIPEFEVNPKTLRHLAIICDGNRRSAKEKGLHPSQGHRLGVEVIRGVMQACKEWGVRHLTFWTWSTENWERDRQQVNFVMELASRYLTDKEVVETLIENKTRFTHFGRKDRLPENLESTIANLEKRTAKFDQRFVNLALDYGGLDEIARATAKIVEEARHGLLTPNDVLANPELILSYLDTTEQPLPDLVIRTGAKPGEIPHTSGFMPLQTSYSGWAFLPDNFPDLTPQSLLNSIQEFSMYKRRLGR
ncbi:MAG: polyprenyl diphosphate synthase [Microgenomates group bacterium]